MLVICMDDPFSSCAHDSWLFPMTYGSWKNTRSFRPEKAFLQKLNLSSKLSSNAHCDLTGKNMCLFLAIHLTIIYNIGRIKFEKKLESSKDIAHLILDKFHSIGIINQSESCKGQTISKANYDVLNSSKERSFFGKIFWSLEVLL